MSVGPVPPLDLSGTWVCLHDAISAIPVDTCNKLDHTSMEMGKLVSTCNLLKKGVKEVTVVTTDPLLWTMSHTLLANR